MLNMHLNKVIQTQIGMGGPQTEDFSNFVKTSQRFVGGFIWDAATLITHCRTQTNIV